MSVNVAAGHDRIEVNRAGIGIAIIGALLLVIAVFLPRVESDTFGGVSENTLIQSGDGWLFIGVAVGIAGATYRAFHQGKRVWAPLILAAIGIAMAVYDGTGDRLALTGTTFGGDPISEVARAGIGIYAAGAGALLAAVGGSILAGRGITPVGGQQVPERRQKTCPDCAETILADANVCKHCHYRFAA